MSVASVAMTNNCKRKAVRCTEEGTTTPPLHRVPVEYFCSIAGLAMFFAAVESGYGL
ncbi:MAG: hypothetical protein ABI348_10490 [Nitrososphaera sp.]